MVISRYLTPSSEGVSGGILKNLKKKIASDPLLACLKRYKNSLFQPDDNFDHGHPVTSSPIDGSPPLRRSPRLASRGSGSPVVNQQEQGTFTKSPPAAPVVSEGSTFEVEPAQAGINTTYDASTGPATGPPTGSLSPRRSPRLAARNGSALGSPGCSQDAAPNMSQVDFFYTSLPGLLHFCWVF